MAGLFLTDEEIDERLKRFSWMQEGIPEHLLAPPAPVAPPRRYRYLKPFTDAAESLIDFLSNPHGRWMFGIREIDAMVRGVGRGELMFVTGRPHCFDPQTQILTERGWLGPDEIEVGDRTWGVDPRSGESCWGVVLDVIDKHHGGEMLSMEGGTFSSLTTPGHRWFVSSQHAVANGDRALKLKLSRDLNTSDYIPAARSAADGTGELTNDEVRLLGWVSTDGWLHQHGHGVSICQSTSANPDKCELIEKVLANVGIHPNVQDRPERGNQRVWSFAGDRGRWVREMLPNKRITPKLLAMLTQEQRLTLIEVLRLADGYMATETCERLVTSHPEVRDAYSLLLAQAGAAYTLVERQRDHEFRGYSCDSLMYEFTLGIRKYNRVARQRSEWVPYSGRVWCVHTTLGSVFVKRGKSTYYSGQSGKTQLVLQSLANNPNAKILYFTPDEVSDLVLMKLVGITRGINGEDLERKIKAGDQDAIELVRRVAAHDFKNLVVIDDGLTFEAMTVALKECEDFWDGEADCVIIDYLELLPGDGDYTGVTAKSHGLKRWLKEHKVPVVCMHQASKTGAARGQVVDMDSMRFGGDDAATFVLGVYRKGEDKSLEEYERLAHAETVTVNVAKNKRPPSKKGEVDLWMDPNCGTVRSLPPGGVWTHGMRIGSPQQLLQIQDGGDEA